MKVPAKVIHPKKLYKIHIHIALKCTNMEKHYFQRAFCAYCHDRIWGLGRQGFKCTQCKLLIHKKCHKLIKVGCDVSQVRQLEKDFAENGKRETDSFLRPGIGAVSEILGKPPSKICNKYKAKLF
jgi:atypical protein kinase C iota type